MPYNPTRQIIEQGVKAHTDLSRLRNSMEQAGEKFASARAQYKSGRGTYEKVDTARCDFEDAYRKAGGTL
jgi:hypothetical protein